MRSTKPRGRTPAEFLENRQSEVDYSSGRGRLPFSGILMFLHILSNDGRRWCGQENLCGWSQRIKKHKQPSTERRRFSMNLQVQLQAA
jgi:hypothetical protein